MVRRVIELVLATALVACAGAPPTVGRAVPGLKAERPDVKVGDNYTFLCRQGMKSFDSQSVITSVDESSIKFTRDGALLENTREGNPVRDERFSYSDFRLINFPLEVGKTWTFSDRWRRFDLPYRGSQRGKVTVVGYEKVRVPAGEFDAFRVLWAADWTGETGGTGRNTGSYWYAPRARMPAKVIFDIVGEPELTCELKEFQLQP